MGLDIGNFFRSDPRFLVNLLQELRLGLGARRRETRGFPITVHAGSGNHCQDLVSILQGLGKPLEQHHATSLRAGIPLTILVKRSASSLRGEHRGLREIDEPHRMQMKTHSGNDRRLRISAVDRLTGLMECHERGGACRVHRHAWPPQIKEIGKPVRRDTHRVPRRRGRVDGRQIINAEVRIVRGGDADKDPGIGSAPRRGLDSGFFKSLPGQLQQQSLLRIHLCRLTRGDPEERGIESEDVAHRPRGEGVGATRFRLIGVQIGILRPAVPGNLRDQILSPDQKIPEITFLLAGQAMGVADDNNPIFRRFGAHTIWGSCNTKTDTKNIGNILQ